MKKAKTNSCAFCGHSSVAHLDGQRCVLCSCRMSEPDAVQESLTFRTSLPIKTTANKNRGH